MFRVIPSGRVADGTQHRSYHLHMLRYRYFLLLLQLANAPLETNFLPVVVTVPVG